ncbi:MAG: hypothetical protein CMB13_00900 [Euryarchaeota archaeon]|jgi:TATA-box binding protein (TBP) (component of TFIID and TFIIIB)|nr:hypothetical protein [Euryarchaeota archaeon]
MMAGPKITVENQVFRYRTSVGLESERLVKEARAVLSGNLVVKQMTQPSYILLIDSAEGTITVHGAIKEDLARMAVSEFLLGLGESDGGLRTEFGPMTASCDMPAGVDLEKAVKSISEARYEERLDAIRIADMDHEVEILVFRNGRTIFLDALSRRISERAAEFWARRFERSRLYT